MSEEVVRQELVRRELRKAYFLRYLSHANKLYENLPIKAKEDVDGFWSEKQAQVGQLYQQESAM